MKSFTEPDDVTLLSKFSYEHFHNQILVERSVDKLLHDWIFMLELQTALFGNIKKYTFQTCPF